MTEADQHRPVVVAIPGDLHLTEPGLENHQAALRVIDDINRRILPDFVQFIGDNVQDATEPQFQLFNELRNRLTMPHYAIPGDHDVKGDPTASRFQTHLGQTYGSLSLRGFRFLRLDTQQSKPLGLSSHQIDWFRNETQAARALGERIVIFQHNYPYQIWENFDGPGIDDWRAIVQTERVEAILCGHTHYFQVANDGRNVHITARSIGDPEGGAPGYLLAYFDRDDFAVNFITVNDSHPIALITHPRETLLCTSPDHVVSGPDQIRVRTWSSQAIETVKAQVDDSPAIILEVNETDGDLWTAPLLGDRLTKGEHTLQLELCDKDGCHHVQSINFMVDPTARYTPIPTVRPVVTSTAFC